MARTAQEVLDRFEEFAEEISLGKNIDAVFYREDYADYQIIMDDHFHCEIREKLIDVFFDNPKHADTRREIIFLLKHAVEYEEWEESPTGTDSGPGDIVLD